MKDSTRWRSVGYQRISTRLRESGITAILIGGYSSRRFCKPDGRIPPDIKIHIFNRDAENPAIFVLVISDRFEKHPRGDIYDAQWNALDIRMGQYERSATPAPRPANLDKLLTVARTLASDFDFVRVDLYDVDGAIYFGKLTFTPGAGLFPLTPDTVDYEWGSLM
ncbi:ATP-grasp fold amidoligase family protein [Caballeronia telluris]|uniref:ATP-grasp fold amidoligase family protein n=1 Tax=Caballeronia telluris TaxID=326475 RepID=UPI001F226DCC|nr:ATP-grasp fold amidoligase family protein [Caballeronia telluris]